MDNYNIVRYALDFAVKSGASSVTVVLDEGDFTMPPSEAGDVFDELAPGEAFVLSAISFGGE